MLQSCSNHMKDLHLPGAQVFQTLLAGSKGMAPWNMAL
jgi:hypothetical protein